MESSTPLITVGIVVLNREWIIDKMLASLQQQTYPHSRIFVLLVDGESKDNTVQTAKQILDNSDFNGYEIAVKKCNIPEGRNLCVEKMKGDFLFFWDSDVIMGANALGNIVTNGLSTKAEIVSAELASFYLKTINEANAKITEAMSSQTSASEKPLREAEIAVMGCTLIARRVFDSLKFDPDLTSLEDFDFSTKARKKGLKILVNSTVTAFDINVWGQYYSDIHIDMPIKTSLSGLRKKVEVNVIACGSKTTFATETRFFVTNKRYVYYLGYIPAVTITIYGLIAFNFAAFAFPIFIAPFAAWQIRKRGIKKGANSTVRSIVIGLPWSLLLMFYFTKHILRSRAKSASSTEESKQ